MTAPARPAAAVPSAGDIVYLMLADGRPWPCTVVSVVDEELLVEPPRLASDLAGEDDSVVVAWTCPDARYEVTGRISEICADGRWQVSTAGAARRVQQREYVRVATAVPARLAVGERVVRAIVVDLSEFALRCRVERAEALSIDTEVAVAVVLAGEEFVLPGRITRVAAADERRDDVCVLFGNAGRAGDRLRRHVFTLQLMTRNAP